MGLIYDEAKPEYIPWLKQSTNGDKRQEEYLSHQRTKAPKHNILSLLMSGLSVIVNSLFLFGGSLILLDRCSLFEFTAKYLYLFFVPIRRSVVF